MKVLPFLPALILRILFVARLARHQITQNSLLTIGIVCKFRAEQAQPDIREW